MAKKSAESLYSWRQEHFEGEGPRLLDGERRFDSIFIEGMLLPREGTNAMAGGQESFGCDSAA
jgi:hypothetical protein